MTTHVQQATFPLASWAPVQPATIDLTLDLCTRYPLRLGGPRQCGIRSLPDNSTHGQHWESNPRPSDLEFNALSTGPHAPTIHTSHLFSVSIGRRLQDPLAELVKLEPRHLGVGMYQHDVAENQLNTALRGVVEECVSFVGVDVNSASLALLRFDYFHKYCT